MDVICGCGFKPKNKKDLIKHIIDTNCMWCLSRMD